MESNASVAIPVLNLDYHRKFNIKNLLSNLAHFPGKVILIINSSEVFDELKNHPRVDYFCFNSVNVGVSRSWNMAIDMCQSNYLFILNSDLSTTPESLAQLLHYMSSRDSKVAMAGPEGSFNCLPRLKDYAHFQKNGVSSPIAIDAVSGFFFLINCGIFRRKNIRFDVNLSPCFGEEWDIGLQIKLNGFESHIIPGLEYSHEWGVSSDPNRVVSYYGLPLLVGEQLRKNHQFLLEKWSNEYHQNSAIRSGWYSFCLDALSSALARGDIAFFDSLLPATENFYYSNPSIQQKIESLRGLRSESR